MNIKINFSVDIDSKILGQYMADLGIEDETKREFVRSHMIASAIGTLENCLDSNGYGQSTIVQT
mgnify:CR=1 FL=1|jgi:hypothetical protein|tara:strand:- start:395 stop:586 length:192 start_codon:yes stop_codon:yes gene_type:complete